jgi:hypothetical protein
MGVNFSEAEACLDSATSELFKNDTTRSVGIGAHGSGYGFHVIRNAAQIVPLSASVRIQAFSATPAMIQNVPVSIFDRQAEIEPHVKLPFSGPGSPGVASLVPEQQRQRPLACGLQIENFDDDTRTGTVAGGHVIVGTIGCFVVLNSNDPAILSNNHVVAGENRGKTGDRIMQQGAGTFSAADLAASVTSFTQLQPSLAGATPALGGVNFNDIDAGVATISNNVMWHQSYLSVRKVSAPAGWTTAAVSDDVYKIGRTTGLTYGVVTSVSAVVGPIAYAPGPCWFRRSLTIEGKNGTMFSDHGDSGSAIVKASTGQLVGLLYAGNGTDTFACPIDAVLAAFSCRIA